jgi:hypothetical protein
MEQLRDGYYADDRRGEGGEQACIEPNRIVHLYAPCMQLK